MCHGAFSTLQCSWRRGTMLMSAQGTMVLCLWVLLSVHEGSWALHSPFECSLVPMSAHGAIAPHLWALRAAFEHSLALMSSRGQSLSWSHGTNGTYECSCSFMNMGPWRHLHRNSHGTMHFSAPECSLVLLSAPGCSEVLVSDLECSSVWFSDKQKMLSFKSTSM